MALYQYHYLDSKNKKKKAVVEAASFQEAKEKLRAQKLMILSLSELRVAFSFLKKEKIKLSQLDLITLTTQLAQLLNAGIPLYESLLSLSEQYKSESFHPILVDLCENIKGGVRLSEALARHPASFSKLYIAMVSAGESVGALDKALEKLSVLLAKERKLKKSLVTACVYPGVVFAFSCVVIFILLFFVVPSLEVLFEDRAVNRFTRCVMGFSHFLTHQWMFYAPLLSGAACMLFFLFKTEKGRTWTQKKSLKLPFVKTLLIHAAMARFTRTMGTLLQGGVSIIEALQISRKVMKNGFLEEIIESAESKIVEGSLLSQELKKSSVIPSLIPRMLSVGEEGGNISVMLHKIADFYEEEVEKSVTRLTALAQPFILVVMGAIVGIIMLAVLLPLTDVSSFT